MKLTERQAVEKSIELWKWLAETGEGKEDWPKWGRNGGGYFNAENSCFLCEYVTRKGASCKICPYYLTYGPCATGNRSLYVRWQESVGEARKKYAKRFLNQLKEILEDMEEPAIKFTEISLAVPWEEIENEVFIAENVEIDLETLDKAISCRVNSLTTSKARVRIVEAVIDALDPEDRKRLEEYRNQ